jgi:hypothetical protein
MSPAIELEAPPWPNIFGETDGPLARGDPGMDDPDRSLLHRTDAPADAPVETLDVRQLGPPEPLRQTLELLPDLDDETVVIQYNDRAPQHLYPKLTDRGYRYETVTQADVTTTVIWADPD